jgi:ADP-ribosylation factor-binding protein GGA
MLIQYEDIPGPALLSSMTENSSAKGPISYTASSSSPFASFTSPSASQSVTPQPQQSAFQPPQPTADPFASLGQSSTLAKSAAPPPQPSVSNDDDEWSFSSALPPEAPKPKEHRAMVSSTDLRIDFQARRDAKSNSAMHLIFSFSNNTAQPISELHFQIAVTKVNDDSLGTSTPCTIA